jgi:hypothetical protein
MLDISLSGAAFGFSHGLGHFDQFPQTSLSVGYRIGQRTFAAPSPIGCRAPVPAARLTTTSRLKSTQLRHWPRDFVASAT